MSTLQRDEQEFLTDNGEVWQEFMDSEFTQDTLAEEGLLEETAKRKGRERTAAYEQFQAEETGGSNKLGEGPVQDEVALAHPSGGTTTEGISGVRSERSQGNGFSPQYEMVTAPIPASNDGAHVETIVEQQDKDMQSATSQPTGQPNANKGEIGGLKWANQVRGYMKKIDAILLQAEGKRIIKANPCMCPKCECECNPDGVCPECGEKSDEKTEEAAAIAQTREAILRMTKLADELDEHGLTEEAEELDELIQTEVAALQGKKVTAQTEGAENELDVDELDVDELNELVNEIMEEELA